jgi:hypothetical protein
MRRRRQTLPDPEDGAMIPPGQKMSMSNIRTYGWLKLAASVVALIAVVAVVFYINRGGGDDQDEFYGYFLRDAKAMQEMGLPVYWLGRAFTATPGGLIFQGPYGLEFGGEVEGGGIFMRYVSWLDGTPFEGTNIGLQITVYSPDAWELAKDRILNPRLLSNEGEATRRAVIVKGRQAELISVPSNYRPVNVLSLILDLDTVVVVGEAHSVLSADGDSELNIFIKNPDLLMQVLHDLRPYPE